MVDLSTTVARVINGDLDHTLLPWQVDIDLTNLCNQDCYYCNSADFRAASPKTGLTVQDYLTLIDRLATWHQQAKTTGTIANVIFSGGGEPTLFKGYEKIVAAAIDAGFYVAMNTNGVHLDRLLSIGSPRLSKMAYLGLDIDAGNLATYEQIRRTKSKHSIFDRVRAAAARLVEHGAPLDVKVLLLPENTSTDELDSIFRYAADVRARSIHFRPGVVNGVAYPVTPLLETTIANLSAAYSVNAAVHTERHEKRNYKRCHQMFLFPSFCADGNLYLCCEYKGQEAFKLCSWVDDFRTEWCSPKHREIYNRVNVVFCKPCRPNATNNKLEQEVTVLSTRGFI